jgi:branched-chain amino acid transport system permease protein
MNVENLVQQIVNALALGGTYALLALGLALVFSILGFINFAHGELLTITGYAVFFSMDAGLPFAAAAAVGVLAAGLAAVLMERVAFRPVRGANSTTLLITSFAVSIVLQVAFQNLISARPKGIDVPGFLTGTISIGGMQLGTIQALSIGISLAALAGLTVVLRRTQIGTSIRAAAEDFVTLRLMGVRANQVVVATFLASGLLAGIAGILYVAQRGTVDPMMGFVPVLSAFIAVVVGGVGNLGGAVAGGFLLGALEGLLQAYLPEGVSPFRDALVLAALIAVLALRPQGLLAAPEVERA